MVAIKEFLEERRDAGLMRALRPARGRKEGRIYFADGSAYLDFSSNDYLGLSGHPKMIESAKRAAEELGTGSSASRLLSGDMCLHHELEEKTAAFKNKETALVFNSGYQANLGVISALSGKNDAVFSDKLNHASIIDGIVLSGAKLFRFNHNDAEHLELLLDKERKNFKNALIITETIFSMDGDRASLSEIAALKEKHACMLMVDEAHATGIFGENGSGVVEEEGLAGKIELIMGTFSKALGSFGAYIACSAEMKEYMINSARSFIYSTALPPSVIAADLTSLSLVEKEPFRRKKLLENSSYFRNALKEQGFEVKGASQIIPIILGDAEKAVSMSEELKKRGYWALPIRPPTVPAGESRIRFSLSYYHTKEILERLIDDIRQIH